jgi:O-acetylhomoserine/O-acetylserine sulfhydrylase-like pyridoxal-dependent enzyme
MLSILLSVASLLLSLAATFIAGSSLSQARQVADRDKRDWKQRKWYDLYFQLSETYETQKFETGIGL